MTDKTIRPEHAEPALPRSLPIGNPSQDIKPVAGLSSVIGSLSTVDEFGDSGDVFDHMYWRGIFIALGDTESGKKFLLAIATNLFMRGQQLKKQHKGKTVEYSFNTANLSPLEMKLYPDLAKQGNLVIPISFPLETSRLDGKTLTPERTKCLLRQVMVPEMILRKRMPAVSATNGYAKMCYTFQHFLEGETAVGEIVPMLASSEPPSEAKKQRTWRILEVYPRSERDKWFGCLNHASTHDILTYFNVAAMYSGCVSSKEVYPLDEVAIAGTTFWSGVHALMTDVSNKFRATKVTADIRSRFENSAFYDDFKKKMVARKMVEVNSAKYVRFLQAVSHVIPVYIVSSTSLKSTEEVQVIDAIMDSIRNLEAESTSFSRKLELEKMAHTSTDSRVINAQMLANLGVGVKSDTQLTDF